MNKHSETFTRDNNMGLVKQCLSSLYKKNIQRLTKVRQVLSPSGGSGCPWTCFLFFPFSAQRKQVQDKVWQDFYTKRESVAAGFLERV